jgi:hypothetical protein
MPIRSVKPAGDLVIGIDPGSNGAACVLQKQATGQSAPVLVFSWTETGARYRLSCFSSLGESRISRHDSVVLLGHALANEVVQYCTTNQQLLLGALIEAPHVGKNIQGALSLSRWAWSLAGSFALSMMSSQSTIFDVRDIEVGMWRKSLGLFANERLLAREKILSGIPALLPDISEAFAHFRVEGDNDHVANAAGIALVAMRSQVWLGTERDFHQRVEASYTRRIVRS